MNILFIILTILGLAVFEIITSIDNAIINAEVLNTMEKKQRQWFLTWGLLFAVFLMRGVIPFLLLYTTAPKLGVWGVLTSSFSPDPDTVVRIQQSSHVLLIGGGVFLLFLFFHWLFLESKNFGLWGERFFKAQGVWFYAVVSIVLSVIVWVAFKKHEPLLQFGAVVGSTAFFIIHGFRLQAEEQEKRLLSGGMSSLAKIAYLEVLDACFSVDGVIGAFAFTFAVPLILIGNGLGAVVLRQLTVGNLERIKKYRYLSNGAMYSIFALGVIMVLDSFGIDIPEWISPVITFASVGYFFWRSKAAIEVGKVTSKK